MCEHQVETKIENGIIITYCKKCGAILAQAPVAFNQSVSIEENSNNGGIILHG